MIFRKMFQTDNSNTTIITSDKKIANQKWK